MRDVPKASDNAKDNKEVPVFYYGKQLRQEIEVDHLRVQTPSKNMETDNRTAPAKISIRGPWTSNMGPIWMPQKKARKT